MDTTAHVTISTEQKIRNLVIATDELAAQLKREGRYVSADHAQLASFALNYAGARTDYRTPGHD